MRKKYLIAGLASGLVPAGLVYGQYPAGQHFDGEVPTTPDTVLVIGTGYNENGTLDPNVVLGEAPWINVSGWVYTDDYVHVNGDGYLWDNMDGMPVEICDFDDVDLGLDYWYDDCRSYTDQCN